MLIVCPSCATSYDVEAASLEPNGRRVRCVRCRTIWLAETPRAEKLLAAADAIAPGREVEPAFRPAVEPATAASGTLWDAHAVDAIVVDAEPARGDGLAAEAPGHAIDIEAPPLSPIDLDDEGRAPVEIEGDRAGEDEAPSIEDVETYAARRAKRGRRPLLRWPLSGLQSGFLALLIVDAIVVGWRSDIVRILPQTASFYGMIGLAVNLRGLNFEDIATTTEQRDAVPVLVVEGNIVNDSRKNVEVPRLKFAVRNPAGDEIYSWTATAPRATLPPGEAVAFHSRLASPPPDGRDVVVRFVTRREMIAGVH